MAFLINYQALTQDVVDVDVVFESELPSVPELVIAVVENLSADDPKYLLEAFVVAKSTTGFSIRLSAAPNTGNYSLAWVAGSSAVIFQTLAAFGVKISALSIHATALLDSDYFPFVHTNPIPVTKRLTWAVLRALFPNLKSGAPASPAAPGSYGDVAVSGVWFYAHNGTLWGRSRLFQTAWDVSAGDDPAQEGVTALVNGQKYIDIPFPVAFSARPYLKFSFRNLVDANTLMLTGLQISGNTTTARVQLNTAPDSGNYEIVWEAKL